MAKNKDVPGANGKLQNKAYGKAMARLRETHREEFDKLCAEEYEALGLVFRKRVSPEERAEQERAERLAKAKAAYDKLLADNPDLAKELAETARAGAEGG